MNANPSVLQRRFVLALTAGLVLLAVCSVLSLRFGAVRTPFSQLIQELVAGEGIVFEYRMPRLLAAIMVGMNMAVAGSIMQAITRNPMAAPDLIGINAGAGLVVVLLIMTVPNFSPMTLPLAAFGGAAAAGCLVYVLALQKHGAAPSRLVLSGIAVGGGLHALISLILVKYAPNAAQALVFLKGSLYARSWEHVEILAPWTLICIPLALLSARYITVLQLDESTVTSLGMKANRARLWLLALVVALSGSAVAVAGTIGFVGLIVPHVVKYGFGPNHKMTIPLSGLLGALLVVISDMLGRVVIPPSEIPAGIITAMIGAPYFLYLLTKKT